MSGWVKLHRKSLDHWLYNEARPHTRREAWEDILLLCNHTDTKVMIQGELIECNEGQSVMSLQNWAKQFKWTIQQVRTFFKLLERDGMINTEGLRKTTRITVCNYAYYQNNQHTDNTQLTSKQHTDNKQITTNKNEKNEKKVGMTARQEKILKFNPANFEEKTQQEWIDKNFPRVQMLKYRLIAPELADLIKKYTKEKVVQTLKEMENKKDLLSKYIDAGLTLANWLKNSKT